MVTYSGGKLCLGRDCCEENIPAIEKKEKENPWFSCKEPFQVWKEGFEKKEEKG